jgi:hypothetical protein
VKHEASICEEKQDCHHVGYFHLYHGNAFVKDPDQICLKYVSNIDGPRVSDVLREGEDPHIIVRMNEHPKTEYLWQKRRVLEKEIHEEVEKLRDDFDSSDQVVKWMTKLISAAQDKLGRGDDQAEYMWSLFPKESEIRAQSRLVIPPFQIGESDVWFGTISQTCIVVDADASNVFYYYRNTVDLNDRRKQLIGDWSRRVIHYSPS